VVSQRWTRCVTSSPFSFPSPIVIGKTRCVSRPPYRPATILLGLGMVQAGWLGHDYVHGRGPLCDALRYMPTLMNGHGVEWWSQKHSMHHTFTNEEHLDNDVMMEPFFFLRPPSESGRPDSKMRKFQHIYGYPLLSIMFWLWRFHSVESAWKRKDKKELMFMAINYSWLAFCMPWQVALGSVFISGFVVASLVSAGTGAPLHLNPNCAHDFK